MLKKFFPDNGCQMILLDLDGTMIDSAPDLAFAIDAMLEKFDRPPAGIEKVRYWIGNGAAMLVRRALADSLDGEAFDLIDEKLYGQAFEFFHQFYGVNCALKTKLYPGVLDALITWKSNGIRLACVTNKPFFFTNKLLTTLRINEFFNITVAGDSLPSKKPHPLPLRYCIEQFSLTAQSSLMVGDSTTDILAARAANIPVICVDYGYNHGRDISEAGPDAVVCSLLDIR